MTKFINTWTGTPGTGSPESEFEGVTAALEESRRAIAVIERRHAAFEAEVARRLAAASAAQPKG